MRILLVIDSLGSGGAQRLHANLAKALSKLGHQVEIFIYISNSLFYENEFISAGIKIHIAEKNSAGFSLKVVKQLRKVIKDGYDGIISTLHAPSIYAALGKIGIKNGKLIVCEVSSSYAPVNKIKRFLFYLSTIVANTVVTNSYNEAKLMRRWIGISGKITTIWNGEQIKSAPLINYNNRKERLSKLLVVGRVAYPKNGLNLLKAMTLFLSRNGWVPEIQWAGRKDIDLRSLKMQQEMEQYLKKKPEIASKFKMLGEVKDVERLYKLSDALIHVSIYEGLPCVICEAMIAGCFVIASDVCDHPIVIGKEERGLLCDPYSPETICEAIEKLDSMSHERRAQIVAKARNFAEENFNIDRMAKEFEKLLIYK